MVIGAALFALGRWNSPPPPRARRPTVVIPQARLAQLRADLGPATDDRLVVERAVDEEILYREALARGLGRDDPSVRWRLAEKMRFLVEGESEAAPGRDEDLYRKAVALGLDREDPIVRGILIQQMRLILKRSTGEPAPDDGELRAYLERHRDRYLQPARTSLWHVFLARERRGAAIDRDARALLARLRAQTVPPATAAALGDPFPPGVHLRAQSAQDLTRVFGPDFAPAILGLAPGSWAGPVRSAYGLHLVWVEETAPARMPPLDAVRSQVLAQYRDERQEADLAELMRTLRAKYVVRVEGTPAGERG
jgi:hypothetical protein